MYGSIYGLFLQFFFLSVLFVDFLHLKIPRPIKSMFRSMLGCSITVCLCMLMYAPIYLKIVSVSMMVFTYIKLKAARKSKKGNLCIKCEEFISNKNKTCSGFSLAVKKESMFSQKAGDYLQNKYTN